MQKRLGVALDIGTTTVEGRLIDLNNKEKLSYFSCLNEQLTIGHDIISRIKFCLERPNGLEKLHRRIISSINFVIENLLWFAKEDKEKVSLIACVGNTALYYFTLSLSPKKLVEPPYQPEYRDLAKIKAETLEIEANKNCEFNFLPNIGGFVGSDALAVILAADVDKAKSPILAVDIGTNGEIILGSKKKIWVASTAAGPAFEGWHTSCGIRAVEGAIESIEDKKGRLKINVIGGGEPKGLSGSALIDIIGILLKKGYIGKSGSMSEDFVVYPALARKGGAYDGRKKIFISQDDVRQAQLAKAAFLAGIEHLRRLSKKDISKLFITGRFGNYLNKGNAKKVGIIPRDISLNKVGFLKDGALKGAEAFVVDKKSTLSRIAGILKKTEHIELGQDSDFQKEFIQSMKF